jgi:hypothetical protein
MVTPFLASSLIGPEQQNSTRENFSQARRSARTVPVRKNTGAHDNRDAMRRNASVLAGSSTPPGRGGGDHALNVVLFNRAEQLFGVSSDALGTLNYPRRRRASSSRSVSSPKPSERSTWRLSGGLHASGRSFPIG